MSDAVNYRDLLGVAPDAGNDEIRAAWQSKIAAVEPSDWRFAAYNEALTELTKHSEPEPEPEPEPEHVTEIAPHSEIEPEPHSEIEAQPESASLEEARRPVPAWLLGALAVLAAVSVAVAAVAWSKPSPQGIEDGARAAQSAAEAAVVPILSYDYRTLAQNEKTAESDMTTAYQKKYEPLFKQIKNNAPGLQAVVTASVVSSSIVRADPDRVQVLVLLDQSTTNKQQTTPLVTPNQATLTMSKVDGDWLVADISTH